MNGTFTFIFLVVLVCLCFQLAQTYLEHRNKNKKTPIDEELEETLEKIDKLEDRIRVLERIITESRFDLKKEIDSL